MATCRCGLPLTVFALTQGQPVTRCVHCDRRCLVSGCERCARSSRRG
jgi:hypothetical protein